MATAMALELLSFYCACCSGIGCCRTGLGSDDDDGGGGDSLDGMSSNDCCTVCDGSFGLFAADSGLVVERTLAGCSSSSDYACAALGTGSRLALII